MKRGEIRWYAFKAPDKRRPVLILTRNSAIPFLNGITVAPITSTIRNIPSEVVLTQDDGVPRTCAVSFDNLRTVPKGNLGAYIAQLSSSRMKEADAAIRFALEMSMDSLRTGA